MIRQGIRMVIDAEADLEVAAEAGSAIDALTALQCQAMDVLILDISLPDRSGLDILQDIRRNWPAMQVLILSSHPEGSFAIRALKAGASGFLNKESGSDALLAAIRKLAAGGTAISSNLADLLVREISGQCSAEAHEQLSDREYQVLCMLAAGKSITQIAATLHRSPNTISTYRSRILQKMEMTSNADLTRYAIAHELITPG
jgi:DNA-binding NarL/FixJ family response regulator